MSWNLSIDDGTGTHQLSLGQAMKQGYNFLVDGHNLIFQVAFAATGVVSYKVCERRISKEEPPSPCLASTVSLLIWGMRFQARARADVELMHCWAVLVCAKLSGFAEQSLNCLAQGYGGGTGSGSLQKQNSGQSVLGTSEWQSHDQQLFLGRVMWEQTAVADLNLVQSVGLWGCCCDGPELSTV